MPTRAFFFISFFPFTPESALIRWIALDHTVELINLTT
jgi:hypothetical protein